ncbi:MAG TPA: hypothetical protein VN776_10790, partial [Terracidiphilus sp.]|nr:hypothetical protein [Terracidiphilus sp.]
PHPPLGALRGTISKKGDHSDQVYLFQDHPALETVRHFRIILGLEYAGTASVDSDSAVAPARPLWRISFSNGRTISNPAPRGNPH